MSIRTLNCSEAQELMASRELGFELDPAQRDSLEAHLAACETCRQALHEEQRLSPLLETNVGCLSGDCEELGARIARELPDRVAGYRGPFRFFRREAVAAVLLFGVGLSVGTLFRGGVGPEHQEPVSAERRGVAWREVEVANEASGAPALKLHGRAVQRARVLGLQRFAISISHSRDYAVAFVIADQGDAL